MNTHIKTNMNPNTMILNITVKHINKIQAEHKTDYHPERFSGLIIRYNGITAYLFKSGKVNFSTNKMALLQQTKDNLDVMLLNYKL